MPELPEGETIRRQLAPAVEGARIAALEVLDARWTAPRHPQEVSDAVAGRRILSLDRRGKYLIWALEHEIHLLVHLRMTGSLLLDPGENPAHTRAVFHLRRPRASAGGSTAEVAFVDPRRFGTAELVLGERALEAF